MSECPCGLTREELVACRQLVDKNGVCTAYYADISVNANGTRRVCNRPLVAHPHSPVQQSQSKFRRNQELKNDLQSIKFALLKLQEKIPEVREVIITASSCGRKSEKGSTDILHQLLELCGFGNRNLKSRAVPMESTTSVSPLDFKFTFGDQDEKSSYAPLQEFLASKNIIVANVTEGQDLLDALLFREEIWTLKKDLTNPVAGKRQLKYIVRGRTDFVRLKYDNGIIGKSNIRYFIEVKKGEIGEPELREAFIQLIGGNVANSWHSPPVFLTNLQMSHYVLFITFNQDPDEGESFYQLNILKFPSFHQAIEYSEASTPTMRSCTASFLVKNTPLWTPPKNRRNEDESEYDVDSDRSAGSKVELVDVEFTENFESKVKLGDNV
jgi:hypothetical protein